VNCPSPNFRFSTWVVEFTGNAAKNTGILLDEYRETRILLECRKTGHARRTRRAGNLSRNNEVRLDTNTG